MSTQVLLIGQDISVPHVEAVPAIVQQIPDFGQVGFNAIPSFTGLNMKGLWELQSPNSPFYAAKIQNFPVQIKESGVTTFDGHIQQITPDAQHSAQVDLRSGLAKTLEGGCIYVSPAPQTPSQAIQAICLQYNIPTDPSSFAAAHTLDAANLAYIGVNLQKASLTLMDTFQQIADLSTGRLYSVGNKVAFDVYQLRTDAPLYTFSDSLSNPDGVTIYGRPLPVDVQKEGVSGFRIETIKQPAISGSDTQTAKSFSGGSNSPVRVLTQQAGIVFGLRMLDFHNRVQRKITFQTDTRIARQIPLNTAIQIEYTQGQWATTMADVVSIAPGDLNYSTLVAVTR